LVLSYLIPGFHHIRRKGASVQKRSDYALALQLEITDFAMESSTPDACQDYLAMTLPLVFVTGSAGSH
jgi:hypothetical protein